MVSIHIRRKKYNAMFTNKVIAYVCIRIYIKITFKTVIASVVGLDGAFARKQQTYIDISPMFTP